MAEGLFVKKKNAFRHLKKKRAEGEAISRVAINFWIWGGTPTCQLCQFQPANFSAPTCQLFSPNLPTFHRCKLYWNLFMICHSKITNTYSKFYVLGLPMSKFKARNLPTIYSTCHLFTQPANLFPNLQTFFSNLPTFSPTCQLFT